MDSENFVSLVRNNFNFVVSKYGFSVAQEDGFQVRFENDEVFLTVHYDAKRSYELDVEIGQLKTLYNGQERPFNLGEVLRTEGAVEGGAYCALTASNSDALEQCIIKLAALVSLNAKEYLLSNKFSFKRLSNLRETECNQYEQKMKLEGVRREVQIAWQDKDYAKVVALYRPVEKIISEGEKKKLSFAEKHS